MIRLNYDRRGESLGIFKGDDKVLIIQKNGEYFTSSYSDSNHYEDNILRIEKFDAGKVWTLVLYDSALGAPYLKRFTFEATAKPQRFVGSEPESRIIFLTDTPAPQLIMHYEDADRPDTIVDASDFIGIKSFKAKGKRLSLSAIATVEEIPQPEAEAEAEPEAEEGKKAEGEKAEAQAEPAAEQAEPEAEEKAEAPEAEEEQAEPEAGAEQAEPEAGAEQAEKAKRQPSLFDFLDEEA